MAPPPTSGCGMRVCLMHDCGNSYMIRSLSSHANIVCHLASAASVLCEWEGQQQPHRMPVVRCQSHMLDRQLDVVIVVTYVSQVVQCVEVVVPRPDSFLKTQ